MSKNFANKIIAERLVLKHVNKYTSGNLQLTGLTTQSISSWANLNKIENSNNLLQTLHKVSVMCHRMTDRSKEAFESINEDLFHEINLKIPHIQKLLEEEFRK